MSIDYGQVANDLIRRYYKNNSARGFEIYASIVS